MNPTLVEMMHFGIPVLAHGCNFNSFSTEGQALNFANAEELVVRSHDLTDSAAKRIGAAMLLIAQRRYAWAKIGDAYFRLLEGTVKL
jgi:glycosyltransferase involved in cell wall biosynthesis